MFDYLKMKRKKGGGEHELSWGVQPASARLSTLILGRSVSVIARLMLLYIPSQLTQIRCGVYVTLAQGMKDDSGLKRASM